MGIRDFNKKNYPWKSTPPSPLPLDSSGVRGEAGDTWRVSPSPILRTCTPFTPLWRQNWTKHINLTRNSLLSPGIIFSIWSPLMDPAWATYQSLEAKTWTSENSIGLVFSTDHKVSPFITREKKYLGPCFAWLISTAVHSLMGGFFVRKSFPTYGFPLRVVLM